MKSLQLEIQKIEYYALKHARENELEIELAIMNGPKDEAEDISRISNKISLEMSTEELDEMFDIIAEKDADVKNKIMLFISSIMPVKA